MKIDCTKNCKMTKEMRSSHHCGGWAEIKEGKINYSCQSSLSIASELEKNFLSCQIYDNELFESCKICELKCKKNENKNIKVSEKEMQDLKILIDELRPSMVMYGVSEKTIDKISKEYRSNKDSNVKNALNAAKISNEALKLIQKGKPIDLAYLTIISSKLLKKIKGD